MALSSVHDPRVAFYFLPLASYNLSPQGSNVTILVLLGIPILLWAAIMLLSLRKDIEREEDPNAVANAETQKAPRFALDYTGRLWVEKGRKEFFKPIRRRGVTPPDQEEE